MQSTKAEYSKILQSIFSQSKSHISEHQPPSFYKLQSSKRSSFNLLAHSISILPTLAVEIDMQAVKILVINFAYPT
jgi:hypothetical protein